MEQKNHQLLSIEEALGSQRQFSAKGVLSEGWKMVKGQKLKFFIAALITLGIFAIGYLLIAGASMIAGHAGYASITISDAGLITFPPFISIINIVQIIITSILVVFSIGNDALAMQRINQNKDANTIRTFFSIAKKSISGPAFVAALISVIISSVISYFPSHPLGLALGIILTVYLTIAFSMTYFIIINHHDSKQFKGGLHALGISVGIVNSHFFSFLGVGIIFFILGIVSIIPFGIGLIWVIPLFYLTQAVIFRTLFYKEANPAS